MKKSVVHKVSKITLVIAVAFGMTASVATAAEPTLSELQTQITDIKNQLNADKAELNGLINTTKTEFNGQINTAKTEFNGLFNTINNKLKFLSGNPINIGEGNEAGAKHIAIGHNSKAHSYVDTPGVIAIGLNSRSDTMAGNQESLLTFNPNNYDIKSGFFNKKLILKDGHGTPGITIGANTSARGYSVVIGGRSYQGALYDQTVDPIGNTEAYGKFAGITSIGADSYALGLGSTVIGAYSSISSEYINGGYFPTGVEKNVGAVINGSFNSIESIKGKGTNGVASSIVGTGNSIKNSNAALIFGAGNQITNSYKDLSYDIDSISNITKMDSPGKFQEMIRDTTIEKTGGSALIIGGGNLINNAHIIQVLGVHNSVENSSDETNSPLENIYLAGADNKLKDINYSNIIGSNNSLNKTKGTYIIGDNYKIDGKDGNIVIGSYKIGSDPKTIVQRKLDVSNALILGHDGDVKHDFGVALGSNSVSSVDKGIAGVELKKDSTGFSWSQSGTDNSTWKSSRAAVSIGDPGNNITRQITGVAAGTNDTDAVNVAQLKAVIDSVINNGGVGGAGGDHTTIIASDEVAKLSKQPTQSTGTASSSPTAPTEQSFTTDGYINVTPDASNTEEAKKKAQNYKIGVSKDTKKAVDNANAVIVNESSVVIDGQSKKITNIAEGKDDYDAVNVGQLNNATTTINNRINNLSHHVDRVDRHARAGIASAMAAGALPQAYLPGKSMIAGGVATYRSASAVAFGLSSVSDDGSRIYKLNASANTEGDAGVAAGVGFQW